MKKILMVLAVATFALVLANPAQAESITLTLNGGSGAGTGTFACTGTNGCYGNDLTLDVSGSGTNWTVTYTINTTGNTNAGAGIAAVSFILTGFSAGAGVTLTSAPGTLSDWLTGSGPAQANGCASASANSICSMDTVGGLNASPLGPGNTYTWVWTITGQTFGGFDSHTHLQALFSNSGATGCAIATKGPAKGTLQCNFDGTGLISSGTGTVPEPGTMLLLGAGLLGLGALRRRLS